MHNNYYFLRRLSQELNKYLVSSVVSACFTQHKDELIIRFETKTQAYHLRATLDGAFSCLTFPSDFSRARKNSLDLFPEIHGATVAQIDVYSNERSLYVHFNDGHRLIFKMHGNRSNALLVRDGQVLDLFKKNLEADWNIIPDELHRDIDFSKEKYFEYEGDPSRLYFTFGKHVWAFLDTKEFSKKNKTEQWKLIEQVTQHLNEHVYYLTSIDNHPHLLLIPFGEIKSTFGDPIKAVNEFYHAFTHDYAVQQEKQKAMSSLRSKISSGIAYVEKNEKKLTELLFNSDYKVWADVLMANLHQIPAKVREVTLENFYDHNNPVTIKLKTELNAQKNAEVFYRKSKNQRIEIETLEAAIAAKKEQIKKHQALLTEVEQIQQLKQLRQFAEAHALTQTTSEQTINVPYHEFEWMGFRILVGRSAAHNDELTFKYGYKEDLWLHAKDVAGSHVLIKYKAGKPFPKEVIERGAQLAAYNSKRKTETLCPVIVTPKKYVRKRKGDEPGRVVVDREEVILVEPRL